MDTKQIIVGLYIALFGRLPEGEGLNYWENLVNKYNLSTAQLAEYMLSAVKFLAENNNLFAELYPQYIHFDTNDYDSVRKIMETIYKNLFNKGYSDDPQGINYWTNLVTEKKLPLGEVVSDILYVALNTDWSWNESASKAYQTLLNRIELGLYTASKIFNFEGDIGYFRHFLDLVNFDPRSLENAKKIVDEYTEGKMQECQIESVDTSTITNNDLKALIYGTKWVSEVITYSFPNYMPEYYMQVAGELGQYFNGPTGLKDTWKPIPDEYKAYITDVFEKVSKEINKTFFRVANGEIFFNIANFKDPYVGFAFVPAKCSPLSGDIFFNEKYIFSISRSYIYKEILHELGHALGLKHPFEGQYVLPPDKDNTLYTVMSYTPYKAYVIEISPSLEISYVPEAFPITFQLLDITALQYLYGKNLKATSGDDIYKLGDLYEKKAYYTVWDAGGFDTLDLSSTDYPSYVNLNPGTFSSVGFHSLDDLKSEVLNRLLKLGLSYRSAELIANNIVYNPEMKDKLYTGENNLAIAYDTYIEKVITGNGDDVVIDNDKDNVIITNGGNDTVILQGGGNDYVNGGAGFDTVKINDYYENFKWEGNSLINIHTNDTITFDNVETIEFLDKTVDLTPFGIL